MDNPTGDSEKDLLHSQVDLDELSLLKAQLTRVNKEREQEKAVFQLIIDSAPSVMWTADQNGKPRFLSQAWKPTSALCWQTIEEKGWAKLG
jgi:hypothetical protein